MGDRQPEHERPEQLGLAGPGGAHDQAVRAHATLRGFLDVQFHRLAVGVVADGHPQLIRGARARRSAATSSVARLSMPSSEVSVVLSARASSAGPPAAAGRSGASWRASASASARDSASGTPMSVSAVPSGGSRYTSSGVTRSPSVAWPGAPRRARPPPTGR